MKSVLRFITEMDGRSAAVYGTSLSLIVLLVDYITGKEIHFPIVYLLPAGIAAWKNQKTLAYATAVLLPAIRVGFHFPWHETESLFAAGVNAPIIATVLVFYVYLVDRIAAQTRELEKEVRTLEGILPICASCKRIRDEKGEYEQIEVYISEHSEASFSHGICPECARKLYPEYVQDEDGESRRSP